MQRKALTMESHTCNDSSMISDTELIQRVVGMIDVQQQQQQRQPHLHVSWQEEHGSLHHCSTACHMQEPLYKPTMN